MKIIIQIVLFVVLIITIVYSCINTKLLEKENQIFVGKSDWSENEIKACDKAINNLNADSTKIIFKKTNIPGQGQAQPLFSSILRKPESRFYIIKVQECNKSNPLCYNVLPDSAKVGLVGHELIHIKDYQTKGFFDIVKMGIKYSMCRKYKKRVEYETDSLTIVNKMGNEVLILMKFIHNSGLASKSYLRKKKKYYMDTVEVCKIMEFAN